MKQYISALGLSALLLVACGNGGSTANNDAVQTEAQAFLDKYTAEYVKLYTNSNEAEWKSNEEIVEGDSNNKVNAA